EFEKREPLKVSSLTHHPNPQRRTRFRPRTWPARDRTTATFICGAPVGNVKQFAFGCPNLSSRVLNDSAEGGNRPLVGRHDVREAVRPQRETPDDPFPFPM